MRSLRVSSFLRAFVALQMVSSQQDSRRLLRSARDLKNLSAKKNFRRLRSARGVCENKLRFGTSFRAAQDRIWEARFFMRFKEAFVTSRSSRCIRVHPDASARILAHPRIPRIEFGQTKPNSLQPPAGPVDRRVFQRD
jgi:hypothetical protein